MRIGIYGLGRFGSFFAKCFEQHNHEVVAYSINSKAPIENVAFVTEDEVLSSDVLIFCVAISSFEKLLKRVGNRIKKPTIVLDTCSVKTYPVKWMLDNIKGTTIVPTHPMFGPDSGKNGVKGLPMVLCPLDIENEDYKKMKREFEGWGLVVREMSAREHDKQAAYSQGVTHFVGRMLERLEMKPTEIATVGYKNLMTIVEQTCNDPLKLFYDLQRFNPYAKEMRLKIQVAIEGILNALEEQEEE